MDGSTELMQLAHLLRVGAGAARDIAILRPRDASAIEELAARAEAIAVELDVIAHRPGRAATEPRPPSSLR